MSGRTRRVVAASVLVAAVAGVMGVLPAPPAGATVERVEAANQARVEIEMGDSVIWEAGDDGHTVTARDGSFDSSDRGLMAEGDQFRWRFRVPGTYAYFCRVHQSRGMQGEIVVVDPSAPITTTTRLTPVSAAATTSTTAAATTTMPADVTTTSRPLATSSTTSAKQVITAATAPPPGASIDPQDPPALNPNAPVLSPTGGAVLPESQAAARRSEAEKESLPAVALVAVAALTFFGAAVGVRARRRRPA
jgi:plastocyanin